MLFAMRNLVEYKPSQEAITMAMLFAMPIQAFKPISGWSQDAIGKAMLFAMRNPVEYDPSHEAISMATRSPCAFGLQALL